MVFHKPTTMKSLPPAMQQGAALPVALIVLLVMTIAALSSSHSILLQEKMTGALRENQLALEAAETTLADAEDYINGLVSTGGFNDNGNGGLYTAGSAPNKASMKTHANWSDSAKYRVATTLTDSNVPAGKYMLELVNMDISQSTDSGSINNLNVSQEYSLAGSEIAGVRVTARGESRDGQSVKIIQAFYGKRL
ncbi:PilX N-terminal domain-containing pilus assembly protein [Halioxenophilus sp. WMMB6]|uniref:pilus assembly PilX family protein n=1 Tax=Halioxenophilus sp. WMMB6 TaxID=3073815 RepID=UPI00295EA5CF|nr:PilX N-terminal domain-containing pilus assembly protein [Halioxenophilus sp. WMMB6]